MREKRPSCFGSAAVGTKQEALLFWVSRLLAPELPRIVRLPRLHRTGKNGEWGGGGGGSL
jgi:hypothetical protein